MATMPANGPGSNDPILRRHIEQLQEQFKRAGFSNAPILNNILEEVIYQDPENRIIWANNAACASVGMKREELIGRFCYEVWGDATGPCEHCPVLRAMKDGQMHVLDKVSDNKRSFHIQGYPVRDNDGQIIGAIEIVLETTERKRIEESLRESEGQFRSLAEQSPNMIFINSGNRMVYVNNRCIEVMGYSREEFLSPGFDMLCLIAPECRHIVAEGFARHARGEEMFPYEYSLVTKNGMKIEAIINTKLIDYSGHRAIMGIITDITDRTSAEAALRISEDRYRAISEMTSDFSYSLKLTDGPAAQVEWVGGAVEKITGYTPEQIAKGPHWLEMMHPEDTETARQHRLHVMSGEPSACEYRIIARDGTKRWIRDYARMEKSDDGNITRIVGAVQDITGRKAAEEQRENIQAQLRQAQKMEAVGRLAGGVAHDFNNLLTAITGYSDIVLREMKDDDPLRYDILEIRKAGERAAVLTRQLLAFSRNQPLESRVVNLNALINDIERMLHHIIGEDVELIFNLDPGLARIKADKGQIEQVVINLAVNSRDAMPGGGKLTMCTRNVTVDEHHAGLFPQARAGDFVQLSIRDTGSGIPPEVQAHIFEPFFTTKEEGKGTGLGLSVAYGIVDQHGGWISVYSEPDHGTEFRIHLPAFTLPENDNTHPKKPPMEQLRGKGQRILLVEDEASVRMFASKVLTQSGYQVSVAGTAGEALKAFENEGGAFDVLFSDIVLPDMPGPRLFNTLLARKPHLKGLLTSGYSDERSNEPISREGGVVFLQKPYLVEDLLRTMKELVEES